MTASDTLRRQRERQAAQRERDARVCARDDCSRSVPARYATDLCARHWRAANGFTDGGGAPHTPGQTPDPPTGPSHGIDQPRNRRRADLTIRAACLLCGSRDVEHRDYRGRVRGQVPIRRQLIGVIPGVPFVTGVRCQACENLVSANRDKVHPVVAAVVEAIGRPELDIWAVRVIDARSRGEPDPEPPDAPWAFTTFGPGVADESETPLSTDEVSRLRSLLHSA